MPPTAAFVVGCPLLGLLLLAWPVRGQVPGTIERFTDQAVSGTWQIYDYQNGGTDAPTWVGGPDPHIDAVVTGPHAINVFADTLASGGKLTGNLSSGVEGIALDVRIDDFSQFDYLDLLILSLTDNKYYQSLAREADDFNGGGWSTVTVSFSETWYYYNPVSGGFESVDLTRGALNNVAEVGFRVGQLETSTSSALIGCDNFRLVPTLVEPVLALSPWTPPECEFVRLPGHAYDVEESNHLNGWQPRPGYTNLTGSGTYSFPIGTEPGFLSYRLNAAPHYHE